jgi:hypothetical protein
LVVEGLVRAYFGDVLDRVITPSKATLVRIWCGEGEMFGRVVGERFGEKSAKTALCELGGSL